MRVMRVLNLKRVIIIIIYIFFLPERINTDQTQKWPFKNVLRREYNYTHLHTFAHSCKVGKRKTMLMWNVGGNWV